MKKITFAISIEAPAIPPKPSTPAISATTRNVRHPAQHGLILTLTAGRGPLGQSIRKSRAGFLCERRFKSAMTSVECGEQNRRHQRAILVPATVHSALNPGQFAVEFPPQYLYNYESHDRIRQSQRPLLTYRPAADGIGARARAAFAPPYLEGLNPEQREAVETLEGPVLVLAGAGTGKTRVLTARIAHILSTGRARPQEILSVTFTNKAAREMKLRVGQMVGQAVEGMPWLGTFHSIGGRILRYHAELAGLKSNFTVLDVDDQIRLLKQLADRREHRREALARARAGRHDRRLEEPRPWPDASARRRSAGVCRAARAASSTRSIRSG